MTRWVISKLITFDANYTSQKMKSAIHINSIATNVEKKIKLLIVSLLLISSFSVFSQESEQSKSDIHELIENKNPNRGVYTFYNEFLTNSPSITDTFYVRESPRTKPIWAGSFSMEPRYVHKNKKVKKVWGYSDGEQAYIFNEIEFFPIEVEGNDLVFYGYDRIDNSGTMAAGAMGGAIGGGIAASVALSNAKSKKIRYTIHPVNGTVEHPDGSIDKSPEIHKELIVYRRSRKESEQEAKFLVDGNHLYSFEQKSYVLLKYPISDTTAKICAGPGLSECITVDLNLEEPTYVKCTYPIDSESSQLILQGRSQGQFDFYKIENKQDKRGAQVPEVMK